MTFPCYSPGMERLPENPRRYFKSTRGAVMIPLSKLKPSRRREKGVAKARRAMRLAYDGKIGRREPLSVKKNPDETYSILDGNSTYAVAKGNGWKRLPAIVQESQSVAEQLHEAVSS